MVLNLDFDGTVVKHEFPNIGGDIGAIPVLKRLVAAGHKLILFTMRSGETLDAAVKWFADNGIPLFGIQKNPTQGTWTSSPKSYAELMIDDSALGCPLMYDVQMVDGENLKRIGRPYVNWEKVAEILEEKGIIREEEYGD